MPDFTSQKKATATKYVKALRSGSRVVKGKVYEVVESAPGEHYIRDGKLNIGWCTAGYFEIMPPTYDHKEEMLRKILTSPVHDCTCKRCGAPIPCAYHP